MRRTVWAGASLMVLAACSGNADPVGENSAGSIRTTAVGSIVGNIAGASGDNAIAMDNSTTAVPAADDVPSPVNSVEEVVAGENTAD